MPGAGQRERAFGNVKGYIRPACPARYSTREVPTGQTSLPCVDSRPGGGSLHRTFRLCWKRQGAMYPGDIALTLVNLIGPRRTRGVLHAPTSWWVSTFKHHQPNKRGAGNKGKAHA